MNFFDNSKFQKTISLFLASLSIGGLGGCKKAEKKQIDEIPSESQVEKSQIDYEAQFNEKLNEYGVTIDLNNDYNEITENTPEISIDESVNEEAIDKDNELKKSITGVTERDRLIEVLNQKDWGSMEESLIIEMFDTVERNYDLRDINNPKEKQMYLRNLVNTINSIKEIKTDVNDQILMQNGWNARADYIDRTIVLKNNNTCDLLHEVDHMKAGSFLNGSYGVDLGFVFQEGSASCREGDATQDVKWIDNLPINVNKSFDRELLIDTCSGSYPAFEEIYKSFVMLGVDLDRIRQEEAPVEMYTKQIEEQLNQKYGNELGTRYIENVNEYISFFNMHGMVSVQENEFGKDVFDVRENMLAIYEHCMSQKQERSQSRNVDIIR